MLSRIEVITKERAGKTKRRIVLNTKKFKVAASSRKTERIVLPRALDAVWDLLDLMIQEGIEIDPDMFEQFLIDFTDAFWQMPNCPNERKFFVAQFCGAYFVFIRLA